MNNCKYTILIIKMNIIYSIDQIQKTGGLNAVNADLILR